MFSVFAPSLHLECLEQASGKFDLLSIRMQWGCNPSIRPSKACVARVQVVPIFLRDSRASETPARVKIHLTRVKRGALACHSFYYPWGKMGTTLLRGRRLKGTGKGFRVPEKRERRARGRVLFRARSRAGSLFRFPFERPATQASAAPASDRSERTFITDST